MKRVLLLFVLYIYNFHVIINIVMDDIIFLSFHPVLATVYPRLVEQQQHRQLQRKSMIPEQRE